MEPPLAKRQKLIPKNNNEKTAAVTTTMISINDMFPDELFIHIFHFIPIYLLRARIQPVCKKWLRLSQDVVSLRNRCSIIHRSSNKIMENKAQTWFRFFEVLDKLGRGVFRQYYLFSRNLNSSLLTSPVQCPFCSLASSSETTLCGIGGGHVYCRKCGVEIRIINSCENHKKGQTNSRNKKCTKAIFGSAATLCLSCFLTTWCIWCRKYVGKIILNSQHESVCDSCYDLYYDICSVCHASCHKDSLLQCPNCPEITLCSVCSCCCCDSGSE